MKTIHVLIIAGAILLSTIVYCLSSRYYLSQARTKWGTTYVVDRWTGAAVIQKGVGKSFTTTHEPVKAKKPGEDDE
jgi:hypothetical protein